MFNSKQKKVISIGLTVSLLALSLAGCGKQKTTGNEILDDFEIDVRLKQSDADLLQHVVHVLLSQSSLAAHLLEDGGEAVAQRFKCHG